MNNLDTPVLARGEGRFVDDLREPEGLLHAAVCVSPVAHGRVRSVGLEAARAHDDVAAVLTAADIPGENQIGGIVQDEPLLADGAVHFAGQPIALVVAASPEAARAGAAAIELDLDELPAVLDPREAAAAGQLIVPSRTLCLGDVDAALAASPVVVQGRVASGAQEHLYLETQAALAVPGEQGSLLIRSSTQAPTIVQRIAARVLGLPMHTIEVDVKRLGGAFGGKEDQATAWAVLAALAARKLQRPVKIVLSRSEDMRFTGKRHPYSSDFWLGLDRDGTMLAYRVVLYQNAGAAADLSPAILERTMFHATGSYHVPAVEVTAHCCRTNLPPSTAFRGFGAPQAMFVMESAIDRAAEVLGVDPATIQERNLLADGDQLPFGMRIEHCRARRAFGEASERFDLAATRQEVREHNAASRLSKRGVAVMPVCFGISFTSTFLNQASALVHVYTDGSVDISTAAVEMGQGVNMKIRGIAAHTLGIAPDRIVVNSTNTTRVANTSPTAASSGADMNGRATELACRTILERLHRAAAQLLGAAAQTLSIRDSQVLRDGQPTKLGWDELVWTAYLQRVSLSAQAHYATPGLSYDKAAERGTPFAYHVYGTAISEVTVDCLRGTCTVDRVRLVHDAGRSLNLLIDRGQVEGGVLQGIGWMTMEEICHEGGRITSDSMTTYKVPDVHSAPEVQTVFLEHADNPMAVLHSKAIGEPPFMYGIGVYFALLDALRQARPGREGFYDAPMTPEKVMLFLHGAD